MLWAIIQRLDVSPVKRLLNREMEIFTKPVLRKKTSWPELAPWKTQVSDSLRDRKDK